MPVITLEELKDRLEAILARSTCTYWIDAMRSFGLISEQEELAMKVRLRAQLREMVNAIPKDEG